MSYTYLQEQGEESLAECFLDIPQYVLLRLNLTAEKSFFRGSVTEFSQSSQSGMMSQPLMERLGGEELMSFAEDSHVKTSLPLVKVQESAASDQGCGGKWPASFARFNPALFLWKTPQLSLLEGLDVFLETWPRWGIMRDGECWELLTLGRRINVTEYGLWPTPRSCSAMAATITPESAWDEKRFPNLETIVGRRMWPTPTCHNAKEQDSPAESKRNTPTLCHVARGGDQTLPRHLNPEWVEWLMGWPLGWTDLKPLETDKFQQWQQKHGNF